MTAHKGGVVHVIAFLANACRRRERRAQAQLDRLELIQLITFLEVVSMSVKFDELRADVATLAGVVDNVEVGIGEVQAEVVAVKDELAALAERLQDDPSEEEIGEVVDAVSGLTDRLGAVDTTLEGVAGDLSGAKGTIGSLDPDEPGGSVEEPTPEEPAPEPTE